MIVRYPNNVLMTCTKDVLLFEQRLEPIVNLLFEKNKQYHGVGLAFNQLGGQESIFIIDFNSKTEKDNSYMGAFINPEIVSHSEETIVIPEGCLSLPGLTVNKERWKTINVRWRDVMGVNHEAEFTGMKSVIFQHEVDHLRGNTILSSLPAVKQKMLVEKLKKNAVKKNRNEKHWHDRAPLTARQRAKEMGIPVPKDAQEKIDIYTGKRMSNE